MEVEKNITEVALKVEDLKVEAEGNDLELEEVKLKVEDKFKRNSLSKFFRMKEVKSVSPDANAGDAETGGEKVQKTSTLSRLFKKKEKIPEKASNGSEVSSRRSFVMRGLVVPWLSSKPSQTNLAAVKNFNVHHVDKDDDSAPQEIATTPETF